jgi:hypothetical protein
MATVTLGRFALTIALTRSITDAASAAGPGARQRLRAWMRHRRSMAELADADARTCRDLGLPPPARDELLRIFQMDPAPLWSIAEVPMPRAGEDASRRR